MTLSTSVGQRRRVARRALLTLTTALCTGLAAPALAESPHPNLDANGVDLTDGSFNLRLPIASVGSGQSALSLVAHDGQKDNWTQVYAIKSPTGSTYAVQVRLGDFYDEFTLADGETATSKRGSGATLTLSDNSMTYRTLDGVTVELTGEQLDRRNTNLCSVLNTGNCVMLGRSMTGKAGLTVLLNWDTSYNCSTVRNPDDSVNCNATWRLSGVSNEAGYGIIWSFATNTVGLRQNPTAEWYRRVSATLANGATAVGTVGYGNPAAGVFTVTTPGGKTWRITGSGSSITGVRRPSAASDTTVVSYASPGVVSSVTSDGVTTSYGRTVSGTTATETVTDAQGRTSTIVSDLSKYRPTSITDPLNRTTGMAYDAIGRPTEVNYPEGNKVQYGYGARGNVVETRLKAKPSVGGADIVTSAGYAETCVDASCNSPLWTRDGSGNQTDYEYDPATGLATSVTAPAPTSGAVRPQTRYSYSSIGGATLLTGTSQCRTQASCMGGADEVKTSIAYDANLLPTSVTTGAGDNSMTATTAYGYDLAGNLVSVDGPMAGTDDATTYRYDADRATVGAIAPDPDGAGPRQRRAVRTSYNADGQVTTAEQGTVNGTTDADWAAFTSVQQASAVYDANGRKVQDSMAAGGTIFGVIQYSYDALGRADCTAVRMNGAAFGSLPGACMATATGAAGPDRITRVTAYDALSRATEVAAAYGTAEASTEKTTFTTNGQVATVTDAENNLTSYGYDGFDRQVRTNFPVEAKGANASSTTDYEQLEYDANGRVTSRRLRDGATVAYSYDALSRLTYKARPNQAWWETDLSYAYDNLGRLVSATNVGPNKTVSFGYDALGRLVSQGDGWYFNGNIVSEYDLAGRRTRLSWVDGFHVTYDYDVTGNMTAIRENGTAALATFAYDDFGRRISLTRGNGTVTSYAYDPASQLLSLGQDLAGTTYDLTVGFGYNPAGQIASRTASNDLYAWRGAANADKAYAANGLNQYTAVGGTAITYDGRGNLTNAGGLTFNYTGENQLSGTSVGDGFAYDPLGRLFDAVLPVNTAFGYDGDAITTELGATSNAFLRRYVYGPGVDEPLVWYEGAGTNDKRWFHADERGSVIAVTNANGDAITINAYDEYGNASQTTPANAGRFGYTGQAWLPSVRLNYYKARMYSPSLGRFMQTDPIGYGDGLNAYNYVGGDPVNRKDPSGLLDCVVGEVCVTGERVKQVQSVWDFPIFSQTVYFSGNFGAGEIGSSTGEAPQSPTCPTGSVGEIRRNLPSKGVGAQIADGVSSYIQGVAWGATALAARTGLLGSGAQQQAINTNGQLGQVLGQIQSHPGQTASFVGAVASKYPVQLASRVGSGVVVSIAASPYVGLPVTGLAAYGTAFKEAYQHPDAVAAAVVVGQSCK